MRSSALFGSLAAPRRAEAEVPAEAQSDPREELIVRYCVGRGEFSHDRRYLSVHSEMFKLDGEPDGHHEGIYELTYENLQQVFGRPAPPVPPFHVPVGPVDHVPARAHSKGTWTFADGSSLTAIGPANVHAVRFKGGGTQLWVTAEQIITNGALRYEGAHGLKTAGDSAWMPKKRPLATATTFPIKTIDVFRVVRKEFVFPGA